MSEMKEEVIGGIILDALENLDDDEVFELVDGWFMKAANVGSERVWDWGVVIGKLDEDGDFVEDEEFVLDGYAETVADLLEDGKMIVQSMAKDIIEYVCENE